MPVESSAVESIDPSTILRVLDELGVHYVLVGGLAGLAHGATRPTADIDCVSSNDVENMDRLAGALVALNARLRVAGMTDEEAKMLPVQLDAHTLQSFGSSTWNTDFGPLDVLAHLRDANGAEVGYGELVSRSSLHTIGGVVVRVAALDDVIASKEFADRPKDREALPELRKLAGR